MIAASGKEDELKLKMVQSRLYQCGVVWPQLFRLLHCYSESLQGHPTMTV